MRSYTSAMMMFFDGITAYNANIKWEQRIDNLSAVRKFFIMWYNGVTPPMFEGIVPKQVWFNVSHTPAQLVGQVGGGDAIFAKAIAACRCNLRDDFCHTLKQFDAETARYYNGNLSPDSSDKPDVILPGLVTKTFPSRELSPQFKEMVKKRLSRLAPSEGVKFNRKVPDVSGKHE